MNAPADTPLHVEVQGRGPLLVLLHGWGLNLRVWDGLAPQLGARFRVAAVDLPGHGRSAWSAGAATLTGLAQRVARTVEALGAARGRGQGEDGEGIAVLGWSLGGQVALELAGCCPSIRRLILVSATPRFTAAEDWPYGMAPHVLERFAAQLETDYRRTVSDFLELQARGSADAAGVLELLRAALLAHGSALPEALAAGLAILRESDQRPQLAGITAPALVVAGQYDRVTHPKASRALAQALPRARYLELRRAGHAPFLSHPAEVVDALVHFLDAAEAAA